MGLSFRKKKSSRGGLEDPPSVGRSRSLSKRISRSFRGKKAPRPATASAPVAPEEPAPKIEEEREASPAPREDSPASDLFAKEGLVESAEETPPAEEEEVAPEKEGEEPAKEDEAASAEEKEAVQEEEGSKEGEEGEEGEKGEEEEEAAAPVPEAEEEAAPLQEEEEEAAPLQEEEEEAEAQVEEKEDEEETANTEEEEEEMVSAVNESITEDTKSTDSLGEVVTEPSIETVEQEDGVLLGWFQPNSKEEDKEEERGLLDSGMHSLRSMIDGAMGQTMEFGAQGLDLLNCGNIGNVANEHGDAAQPGPEARDLDAAPKAAAASGDEAADAADGEAAPADGDAAREDSFFLHPAVLKKVHDFMSQARSTVESSYSVADFDKTCVKASAGEASDSNPAVDVDADDRRNDSEEADPSFSTFSSEEIRQEG